MKNIKIQLSDEFGRNLSMATFGEVLKKIRKTRGMRLIDLEGDGISYQSVSLYEQGKREPSYRTFCALAKRTGSTLEEFQYEMNDYELDEFSSVLAESSMLFYENNIQELKKLLNEEQARTDTHEYRQDFTCLMIKNTISRLDPETSLTEEEKDKIVNYLYNTKNWGYYELTLLGNTIEVFDSSTLAVLSNELISRTEYYKEIPKNKGLIIATLINALGNLIYYDDFDAAIKLKKKIEKLLEGEDLYYRTRLLFSDGMLDLSMGVNIEEAKKKMQDAILIFKLSGSLRFAEVYQASYDNAVRDLLGE